MYFSSLLYALVVFRNSKKQLNQQKVEKFKSSCQFYASTFFGKKKKVCDFILAQRTEGDGSIFFNNVGSPREMSGINIILRLLIFWIFSMGHGLTRDLKAYILLHKFAHFKGLRLFRCQIFQRLRLFKGLRLFRTLEYII